MRAARLKTFIALAIVVAAGSCATEVDTGTGLARILTTGSSSNDTPGATGSLADVTSDRATQVPAGQVLPTAATVNVQVKNESGQSADVTLRFWRNQVVVHLTILRVAAGVTSLVVGPDEAEFIEAGGTSESGSPLPAGEFFRDLDFNESKVAVYVIGGTEQPAGQPNPDEDDTPGVNDAPVITMLAPASDVEAPLGSLLTVQWTDADPDDDAHIGLLLRPADGNTGTAVQLAPLLAEDPDGLNDRLRVVIEDIAPGQYEVVGAIDDGSLEDESVAPGLITVVGDPENPEPSLTIQEPASTYTVIAGESVPVVWEDESSGDAFITFYLDRDGVAFNGDDIQVSPPLAAAPDGDKSDSGRLPVTGVGAGEYDLLGVINDGERIGTARAPGRVRVINRAGPPPPPPPVTQCSNDEECDDGVFCNGIETCSDGFCFPGDWPCEFGETCSSETGCVDVTATCTDDEDCLDGIFCNGFETCSDGFCVPGGWPCSYGDTCDEEVGCFELRSVCDIDEDCDDGFFCNGFEQCLSGLCFGGEPPCTDGLLCDEDLGECVFLPPAQGPLVFAYPDFDQSSRIFVDDVYGDIDYDVIYFLDDFDPEPGDELRFYWVPVNDPGTRLQISPTPAIDIFEQPYGLAILQPWPLQEFGLLDCVEIRLIDVYIEVDLVRNDGTGEVLLHTTRVQQFLGDAAAGIGESYDPTDVVIRVDCFDDFPR